MNDGNLQKLFGDRVNPYATKWPFGFEGADYELACFNDGYGYLANVILTKTNSTVSEQNGIDAWTLRITRDIIAGTSISSLIASADEAKHERIAVTGHPVVKTAVSVWDAVFQIMQTRYNPEGPPQVMNSPVPERVFA